MKVTVQPLHAIFPYDKNARKIPQSAVDAVALSLKTYGWQQPIVVDAKGVIVVGHTRRLAALQLGWTEAPVTIFTGTAAQAKAYRLMDNRSHEEATWEPDLLRLELLELKTLDLDLGLTGFNSRELDAMLRPAIENEDDAPPVPEVAVTQPGDLWTLGEHRLLCGDATDPDAVKRVCAGEKADMIFVDPPYNVNFGEANHNPRAKRWAKIKNDQQSNEDFRSFVAKVFSNMVANCREASPVYCWAAPMAAGYEMLLGLKAAEIHVQSQIIWYKNTIVLGQADYQWRHEPCWYGWTPGKRHYWSGGRALSTVWEHKKDANGAYVHPAQKPVSLAKEALKNSCKPGGTVIDVFSGSGSTIAAADLSQSRCFAMELDPVYVDVAVKRWMNLTGKQAYNQDGVCFPA